jgi:hypothetical protein
MKTDQVQRWIEDFSVYCVSVDLKQVVAAADEEGNAPGWEKQLYAVAIVRALHQGILGNDWLQAQSAVARLWQRGRERGFNTDNFNDVLLQLAEEQPSWRSGAVYPRSMRVYNSAVGE